MSSTAMLSFSEAGEVGQDPYDAYRLEPMNNTWLTLYTSSPRHELPLIINNLPLEQKEHLRIPLFADGVKQSVPVNGSFTLQWSIPSSWPADWLIALMDHQQEEVIHMLQSQRHQFEHQSSKVTSVNKDFPNLQQPPPQIVARLQEPVAKSSADPNRFTIVIIPGGLEEELEYSPDTPVLLPPYPNPASTTFTAAFRLPEQQRVRIQLIDNQGRLIATLADQVFEAGKTSLPPWPIYQLTSGLYILKLTTSTHQEAQKISIIR